MGTVFCERDLKTDSASVVDSLPGQTHIGSCIRGAQPVKTNIAAAMNMITQATALGIGSCWIGHFSVNEVRKVLQCTIRPTIVLILGYEDKQ